MVVQSLFYLCIVVFSFFLFCFFRCFRCCLLLLPALKMSQNNLETFFVVWAIGHSQTFSNLSTWKKNGECRVAVKALLQYSEVRIGKCALCPGQNNMIWICSLSPFLQIDSRLEEYLALCCVIKWQDKRPQVVAPVPPERTWFALFVHFFFFLFFF